MICKLVARDLSFPPQPHRGRRITMAEIHDQFDTILILDFGSQVSIFRVDHDDN
jgi:hypothetical protein